MDDKTDRVLGSVLGLALGDAFGALYEGGPLERGLWMILGKTGGKRRWTDDTQMTIDVIASLVACGGVDQDDLAHRFADSYRWSRGYGPSAARVLKRIRSGQHWKQAVCSVFPQGSFGNGGAMRAPAVGLFHATNSDEKIAQAASEVAAITHAHPLGREGAVLVALATAMVFNDTSTTEVMDRLYRSATAPEYLTRLRKAGAWLRGDAVAPTEAATELGNGIAAVESVVTAIYTAFAFRERPYDALLKYCISLHGDVDTIAAMASAIWGGANGYGKLPRSSLEQIEARETLEKLAHSLARAAGIEQTGR